MMFDHLRDTPWNPTFDWVPKEKVVADRINVWHEDYPFRVEATLKAVNSLTYKVRKGHVLRNRVESNLLLRIHYEVFRDKWFAGRWREGGVRVGLHVPPAPDKVEDLMRELERLSCPDIFSGLVDWYSDFETIHPFQDGNGRVGGIVVAAYSHYLHPDKGWLGPNQ